MPSADLAIKPHDNPKKKADIAELDRALKAKQLGSVYSITEVTGCQYVERNGIYKIQIAQEGPNDLVYDLLEKFGFQLTILQV